MAASTIDSNDSHGLGFGSTAIHTGHKTDTNRTHLTPIYATSTFTFDSAEQGENVFSGKEPGYVYTRWGNPNFTEAEEKIAALESFDIKDEHGTPLALVALLHASGQAAMTTMFLANLQTGDKVLTHNSLYGGTHELLHNILPPLGISCLTNSLKIQVELESILTNDPHIKWIHLETPSNPTLQCVDIAMIVATAQKFNVKVSVDNTFATPYLQQPFRFGVDYVFHSTTKFLNGHGTAIGGILVANQKDINLPKLHTYFKILGGNASPFDAWLLVNGLKTIELRMQRHCANAQQVADFLFQHPHIAKVNYTGHSSHPDFQIARRQMRAPGPVLSFELHGGTDAGSRFINKLNMCTRAVSLGTTDTLISHPASMTHKGVPSEIRHAAGISDGLIRMSVGIENVEDIIADLTQALK